jgi:hypothetical protein
VPTAGLAVLDVGGEALTAETALAAARPAASPAVEVIDRANWLVLATARGKRHDHDGRGAIARAAPVAGICGSASYAGRRVVSEPGNLSMILPIPPKRLLAVLFDAGIPDRADDQRSTIISPGSSYQEGVLGWELCRPLPRCRLRQSSSYWRARGSWGFGRWPAGPEVFFGWAISAIFSV